ncbi:hypothetical protein M0R45_031681 [Rubus argutus]|uniref:Uncharacterized protein n=1 Tax=Rubus argutus TaxID=59490 RepID=A0AAW1WF10_RUBAR
MSLPQGHRLGKTFQLENRAHYEIRKRAETVIWNIQMIKRYRNKIPGEIVKRIEDEVLDLRKTMGRRSFISVISEIKSKLDKYLSRWRNDQRFWGSGDHSAGDKQGGYYRGEASWDHSVSDIHTMKKILFEYGDKVPSDVAREIEGAIADLGTAMEGGNADEIKAKLDDASKAVSKIGEHMYGGGSHASSGGFGDFGGDFGDFGGGSSDFGGGDF